MPRTPIADRLAMLERVLPAGASIVEAREDDVRAVLVVTGSLGDGQPSFHSTIVVEHLLTPRYRNDAEGNRRLVGVVHERDDSFLGRFSDALDQTLSVLRAQHPVQAPP